MRAVWRYLMPAILAISALRPSSGYAWFATYGLPSFQSGGLDVSAADGVVAVGHYAFEGRFLAVKLSPSTGEERWRYDAGPGVAYAVAIDAAGDVIVAGSNAATFVVVKLASSTGEVLWSTSIANTANGYGGANGVAVDLNGDVIAVGTIFNAGTAGDAVAVKLSGATGMELWRYTADGAGFDDTASAVRIDPLNEVVIAETLVSQPQALQAASISAVVKLNGATGGQVWRNADYPDLYAETCLTGCGLVGSGVSAIALNDAGDVAAEGYLASIPLEMGVQNRVFLLAAGDGSERWHHDQTLHSGIGENVPRLALRPSGDVIATDAHFTATALDRSDGHELWRRTLGCTDYGSLLAMAVDPAGDVIIEGRRSGCSTPPVVGGDFTIAKLAGMDGTVVWQRSYDTNLPNTPINFSASALATSPTGDIAATGSTTFDHGLFTVLYLSDTDGALGVCGDGYVDTGEECDPGDVAMAGCCSNTCRAISEVESCFNGNYCTINNSCQHGECLGGTPLLCEPCGTCDPSQGCLSALPFTCLAPTATNKAVIRMHRRGGGQPDTVTWIWSSGAATTKTDFGEPRTATGYALCIFAGDGQGVLFRAEAPAGCSRKSGCWQAAGNGFRYRSVSRRPDGLVSMSLRAGPPGRAQIIVKGKGRHLILPTLPLTASPTVQVRRLDGSPPCWGAVHGSVVTNRTHEFVARGN